MSSPGSDAVYMDTLAGYAYWYLSKGRDPAEVAERIRLHKDFGTPTRQDIATAIARGQADVAATRAVRAADETEYIRAAAAVGGEFASTIGVRVVFRVQHPSGQMGSASVVVNVSSLQTIEEVLQAVRDFVASGGLRGHTHKMYGAEAIDAYIGAVAIGGYQNSLFTL